MIDMRAFDLLEPGLILDRIWDRLMDLDMEETDTFNPSLNNQPCWAARCIVANLRYHLEDHDRVK
jgi:hypothetical protein